MLSRLLVLCAIVGIGLSKQINYKDCGSVSGKIIDVDVNPCDSDPCVLHRGTNYTISVNLTETVNSSTAKTIVHGIIGGVPVPFPVPSDCCNNHNLPCPLVAGTTTLYTNYVYCSPSYPKIKLIVKWEVQDDNNKDVICFEAPLVIDS